MSALLTVQDLQLEYATRDGPVRALDGADLDISAGETIGIVGESGSGKSTLGLAVGRLLPGNLRRAGGDLLVNGHSVFDCDAAVMRRMRRDLMGFVFQNPMLALDPTLRVGAQLVLAMAEPPRERATILDQLERVGLREPERVARSYPHELSGGMAQRVVIAAAIARDPAILIADEPTASLDATVRDQVLELLFSLCRSLGASILLLSHELRVVARTCDRVAVMYGGRVVETGTARAVFRAPAHPYTQALVRAAPGHERRGETLQPIAGTPPVLRGPSPGCSFAPRCRYATDLCRTTVPPARRLGGGMALCHYAGEIPS